MTRKHKSRLVEALEKRKRWSVTLDMKDVIGHGLGDHDGTDITKCVFRVNVKSEDDAAVAAAHAIVARLAKRAEAGSDDFKSDDDVLIDNKSIQALYRACRDPDDDKEPLFITPDWMRENLDTDILAGFLNAYNECRRKKSGQPEEFDGEFLDNLASLCVAAFDSELPEAVLKPFGREVLSHILILMVKRFHDEREATKLIVKEAAEAGNDTVSAMAKRHQRAYYGTSQA